MVALNFWDERSNRSSVGSVEQIHQRGPGCPRLKDGGILGLPYLGLGHRGTFMVHLCSFFRDRTKRRKGKKATSKQRKANAVHSKWSFAELQSMIAYKALFTGSMAIKVEANYTSQACLMCGHTSPENRPDKGLIFCCQKCHYTLHADLVGSRNITMRTLLMRQDWMSTGELSDRPDVSDKEAKAARLSRFAELRWSLDTSLKAFARGL